MLRFATIRICSDSGGIGTSIFPNVFPLQLGLLERIHVEKEQLIKDGKIKRDKHESVIFRRDNSHYEKRGSEDVCIDNYMKYIFLHIEHMGTLF